MRSQADRDETTLRIATGVVWFTSVLALAAGTFLVVGLTVGSPDVDGRVTFSVVLALAAWWAVRGTARPTGARSHQG
ncbi:hypothetical protein GCM10023340_11030 [Nocardioides marinquilinus]|uniref:DUF2530 domain-containing protein n=1 Tax=Nocardioides marinquilinus TaxID=1210400 RepID=A0ABP9PI65_9ACTN